MTASELAPLLIGTAAVAALYASVGHGGASGYLAVMTLLSVQKETMRGTALVLNLLVAGFACLQYVRAGHWRRSLFWPFVLGSVPAAWLGGRTQLPKGAYEALLAAALAVAGWRLLGSGRFPDEAKARPTWAKGLVLGAVIGLVSGLVGVGGGIFLSPILLFAGWATAKESAAASAAFIVANSAAGLAGYLEHARPDLALTLWMLAAAAAGGFLGATWGARHAAPARLRQLLGGVLLVAALKAAMALVGT